MIVVVGSLNTDLVLRVEQFPTEGETVLGDSLTQSPGGKGLNQAIAASRAGGSVVLIGSVGNDSFGRHLKEVLATEEVRDLVETDATHATGTAVIEVESGGANRIIVVAGANEYVDADRVENQLRAVAASQQIGIVLVQGEIHPEATERALTVGKELGAVTILNPAPMRNFPRSVFSLTDYLIPNECEAHALAAVSEQPLTSMLDCVEAANSMVNLGAKNVIVTRGEKGAVWANANGSGQAGAFRIVPVDTVAAGDSFCGVFACAINEGQSLAEALRWASAAGALAATRTGALTSLPQREEIMTLLGLTD